MLSLPSTTLPVGTSSFTAPQQIWQSHVSHHRRIGPDWQDVPAAFCTAFLMPPRATPTCMRASVMHSRKQAQMMCEAAVQRTCNSLLGPAKPLPCTSMLGKQPPQLGPAMVVTPATFQPPALITIRNIPSTARLHWPCSLEQMEHALPRQSALVPFGPLAMIMATNSLPPSSVPSSSVPASAPAMPHWH